MPSTAHRDPTLFRSTLELLPAGAYTCDPSGRITWFNEMAAALWGRRPDLGDESVRYCGSVGLLSVHMQPIAHHASWMAMALRDRRAYLGQEFIIIRPDRSQVTVLAYATPLMDDAGDFTGAVNILVNISDRKRVEQLLADANRANEYYRAAVADAMRDELAPMDAAITQLEQVANTAFQAEQLAILRRQIGELGTLLDQLIAGKANRHL